MFGGPGVITGISVAHQRASVDEIAAAGATTQRADLATLTAIEGVDEAFALQTCNRAEAYVVTDDPATGRDALSTFAPSVSEAAIRRLNHEESIRHVMRVSAGLESLVLGEDHVLGQLREAYQDARSTGAIGPTLEEAVTKAIHVGERARTETGLNDGVVSLGSAAVAFADEEVQVDGATAAVLGAGEMGTIAAKSLANHGVDRLYVVNRTIPHAEHVAGAVDVDASAVGLSAVPTVLEEADVVLSTTASDEPLIEPADVEGATPTTFVDLAQPRDVHPDVDDCPGAVVYDLDDLERVTERTRRQRQDAATEVETLIDDEFDHLLERYKRKRADEAIATMYERASERKDAELDRAIARLEATGDLTDEQRDAVESMADALVNKLLAPPTSSLRDAAAEDDWTTIHTALQLFDPGLDDGARVFEHDAQRLESSDAAIAEADEYDDGSTAASVNDD